MPIPPLDQWPPELLYLYHERAAIKEFEGGMERGKAESQALSDVWPQGGLFNATTQPTPRQRWPSTARAHQEMLESAVHVGK